MGSQVSMESIVNCPVCKQEVNVNLYQQIEVNISQFAESLGRELGLNLGSSDRYESIETKCKCGKTIVVTMTVTAL
jgi:hypothetical protein